MSPYAAVIHWRAMALIARRALAVALVLTFGAVPLAGEWCLLSCESGGARATAATPPCHHPAGIAPRVGHAPDPCGQTHQRVVVDAAATARDASRGVHLPAPTAFAAGTANPALHCTR